MLATGPGRRTLRLPNRHRNIELADANTQNHTANDKLNEAI